MRGLDRVGDEVRDEVEDDVVTRSSAEFGECVHGVPENGMF